MPSRSKTKDTLSERQVENIVRIVRKRVGQIEGACGFSFGDDGYVRIHVLGADDKRRIPLEIAGIPVVAMPMARGYIKAIISIRRRSTDDRR